VNPETWRRAEELFQAALERPEESRESFLHEVCGGDPELRGEVERLLARSSQPGSFLEHPPLDEATATMSPSLIGREFGSYRIVSRLGAGGMGEVYRAHDTALGRDVALKTLPDEFARDSERLARFRREARTLASLNHPSIGAIYGIERSGDVEFLVLELVEGETLRGPLPVPKALDYARQVAQGLHAAHEKGIVHRDVKPDNIKVTPDGRVKVLDFGLAKPQARVAPALVSDMGTVPGLVVGTPAYMSPEQARGAQVDQRTDIWAFGCLLYHLLSGKRAFPGDTAPETIAALFEREPDWRALPARTPEKIRALLRQCLEKDPSRRMTSLAGAVKIIEDAPKSSSSGARRGRRIRSLAVLPLANLSGDAEHDYFADGMTDALITTLAQIGSLRVISRTSVMRYKGTNKPLPEIARELNVESVLEGSVLRSGNRVRIAAQLIDALADSHLWARNYDASLEDILMVQSEVAQAVAQEIQVKLTPQERARFSSKRAVDPDAYECFLRGRFYWYKRSPEAIQKSLEYLHRAIAIDPTYAPAYAGLADTFNTLGWDLFGMVAPAEAFPKATSAAKKALELDPNCAEAHAALGWAAAAYDWDWAAADRAFRRAIQLKPQYGPAHMWYSHLLHAMKRVEEAFEHGRRAIECDPLGVILNLHLGWHLLYHREFDAAVVQLRKTIELDPSFILARLFLGEAFEQLGEYAEAIAEFQKAVDFSARRPVYLAGLGHAYAVSGQPENAGEIIAELSALSGRSYVSARGIAEIYIGLGDKQLAFEWLERAVEQRNGWLFHIDTNPRYDSIRSDPRYADLVRRIGLPD
jgi:serine/threonine-protein kinase